MEVEVGSLPVPEPELEADRTDPDTQRSHGQAELHRPQQPPLEPVIRLAAGDEIEHHVADPRALIQRVDQQSR